MAKQSVAVELKTHKLSEKDFYKLKGDVAADAIVLHGEALVSRAVKHLDQALGSNRSWMRAFNALEKLSKQSRSGNIALEMFEDFVLRVDDAQNRFGWRPGRTV